VETDLEGVRGTIFAVDQTAVHDGPGVRMTVYFKGCPLRCVWCHSPESISFEKEVVWYETRCARCGRCIEVCPEKIRTFDLIPDDVRARCRRCGACIEACPNGALEFKGRVVTAGEVAREAERLKPFFARTGGGITLTGGEPTAQPDFAFALAGLCRQRGIHVAVETCGFNGWEVLKRLAGVVDLFLYDIKHPDDERHRRFTGVSNRRIFDNLRRLIGEGADVIVRVPLIPGHNDSADVIEAIGAKMQALGARKVSLLPFNPATAGKYSWLRRKCPLEGAKRQSDEQIAALEGILRGRGLDVVRA